MATYVPPKRATAFRFWVSLVDQADVKKLKSNPTLAAGDVKVSKDGGALANLTTLPAVTPASSVLVQVDLSATEMTADNVSVVFIDAAGAEWCDLMVNLQTSARQVDDLAFPNVSGRGMDVSAGGDVDAAVVSVAAGAIDAAAIATGAIDADAIAADAAAEIADAVLDEDMTAHQTQGTLGQAIGDPVADADTIWGLVNANLNATVSSRASQASVDAVDDFVDTEIADIQARLPAALVGGRMAANAEVVGDKTGYTLTAAERDNIIKAVSGTADAGGSTTTIVDAERTEADTDYWKDSVVLITSGACVGQVRRISAFNATTDTITVDTAFTQAIATGVTYLILRTAMQQAAGAGATDWTAGEKQQIRDALGVDGTKTAATGGQLQALDDYVDTEVGAIKAVTDQFVFTNPGKVDSAVLAAGDFAQAAADKVWASATRTLTAFSTGLAVSVWDVLESAIATASSIGLKAKNNLDAAVTTRATPAQVNAEVVDALNVDTYAEPGQAAPPATATLAQKIGYLFKAWRNRTTQDATTYKLYADDATTVDQKATVSDDGTTFDRQEIVTGP